MAIVTKQEFADWKNHPVTEAFFEACNDRVEDMKELLAVSAGFDSVNDSFNRGFIRAYREMQEFRPEEEDE